MSTHAKPVRSLSEVAAILQLDRRQVWYIERRALAKLRRRLSHLEPMTESREGDLNGEETNRRRGG